MRSRRLNKPRAQKEAATGGRNRRPTLRPTTPEGSPPAGRTGYDRNEFAVGGGRRAPGRVGWKTRTKPTKGAKPCPDMGL